MGRAREAAGTERYERKREAILFAAQQILYRRGVKGMTLADVAAEVGLNATSITYYFRKKEDLATACFLAGIARLEANMTDAAQGADVRERLTRALKAFFARHRAARLGEESQIVSFSDMRALEEPHIDVLNKAFAGMVQKARALFDGPELAHLDRAAKTARAHLLLEQIFWSAGWLHAYDVEDYPRVLARTTDIFIDGLAPKRAAWAGDVHPVAAAPRVVSSDLSLEDFLAAATRLINKFGHRGASVEKISAELNVTKGSFYHHNEAKGDLVESCFMRTHDIMKETQRRAMEESATQWDALSRTVNTLVDYQVSPAGPLLRTSILPTLPEPMRTKLTERLNRVVERFAAMISDGIAEGSIRAIDPAIAAQMFKVAINATADAPSWVRGVTREDAPALYAKPTLFGALAR